MPLINFNKQIIGDFQIPSFKVKSGDMVVIQFPNGPYFDPLMMEMVGLATGKTTSDKVEFKSPFRYAEHIKEPVFRRRFFPWTVGEYLNKFANKESLYSEKIYDIPWMTPGIKVQTLAGNPRRKLAVYATLSWTNQIIFDLAGVDPKGGEEIYKTVKEAIGSSGAAILIDFTDEFKNDCNVFVRPQYVGASI